MRKIFVGATSVQTAAIPKTGSIRSRAVACLMVSQIGAAAALSPSGWAEDETTLQAADFEPRLEPCCA